MKPETLRRLAASFEQFPCLVGTPATEDEVLDAERRLGCQFDPDYREFLLRFGGATVGSEHIHGLSPVESMDDEMWSVVALTEHFRGDGWRGIEGWYICSMDGRGNPIGLKPDGTVWCVDHDVGDCYLVSEMFEGFIEKCLGP